MAEYGANLTATAQDRPSIFEVLAQENLYNSVQASLRHLIKFLAKKWPLRFQYLDHHFNKCYTLINFLVQHYYLKYYGGSIAENFYDLRRAPNGDQKSRAGFKLPISSHIKSLIALCLASEFKKYLDRKFEDLQDAEANGQLQNQYKKMLRLFVFLYPFVHAFLQGSLIFYQAAYVLGKFPYHSPLLHWAGCHLVRLTDDDLVSSSLLQLFPPKLTSFPDLLNAAPKLFFHGMAVFLAYGLNVGAFFIQYLDWWQSTNQPSIFPGKSIPPPPKIENPITSSIPNLEVNCPLCYKKRVNETVLATSGFVFCYKCIHHYVTKNKKCPVTKYVTSVDQLIRLYPGS